MVKKVNQKLSDSIQMQPTPKSGKEKVNAAAHSISKQFARVSSLLKAHPPKKTHSFQKKSDSKTSEKVENFLNSE